MKCANCAHENDSDAAFCENCGAPLSLNCPNCGAPVKPGAKFCKRCGTAQEIQEPRPSIQGERKPVTILFTDIVGSTSLAEKFDPEDWKEIVSEAHRIVSQVINRYGGTIAQLLGDGVLAFFGAPVTHEDDPVRAVRAALDIQEGMAEYARRLAGLVENWKMRVGVNTGVVVVGNVGSELHMEYLAIGDSVNLAARLQSAARPGGVLISEFTHRLVAHAFECLDLGEINVKGKTETVRVYEVEKAKPRPERARGLAGLPSPMIGRNAEMGALRQAWAAVNSGIGRIVSITGEPGLGKSRLIEEWKAEASGFGRWAEGQCLSYGQGIPYHTIVDMLHSLLRLPPTANERETREALISLTQELLGDSAFEVYPYLGHLLSLQLDDVVLADIQRLDPPSLRGQYLAALRRLLLALASRAPLVVVLEDIHWADASSTELLLDLIPLTSEAAVLLCFTARPDHDVPGWKLVTAAREMAEPKLVEVILLPLSLSDSRKLVSNLLEIESLPEDIRNLILEKAEGNPFFVEEVIRMLMDRGLIVKQGEAWVAQEEIGTVEIPGSLQALLLARIDRLVDELKYTLRAAAVVGRQFSFDVLEQVLSRLRDGAQGRTLANYLGALGTLGFVRQLLAMPELEYIFRHALVQEAAYLATLKSDRRILHRAVGEAIESLFPQRLDEFSPILAFHFEHAEDWPRAEKWLTHAADRAFSQMALPEATDLYWRALAASGNLPPDSLSEFELRFRLAQCMMMKGVPRDETAAEYERCLVLAPDALKRAEVHFRMGELYHIYTGSELAIAESHYKEALTLLGDGETTELYCKVLGYLGYLYRYQSKLERSVEILDRALRLARQLGSTELVARVLNFLSGAYLDLGREEEALFAGLNALEFAEASGNLELIGLTHSFLTDIYLQRAFAGKGSADDALAHIQEMRRHGREYGVNPLAGFGASGLASYNELKGDHAAAVEAWQESARAWSAAHASRRAAFSVANSGRCMLQMGKTEEAEQAFARARAIEGPGASAWAELWIGLAYASAGQETAAIAPLERAFTLEESVERRHAWLTMIRTDVELERPRSLPAVAALLSRVEAMLTP